MANQPMNFNDICKEAAQYFSTQPEIKAAYIFGSHAQGLENKLSDIDLAILIDKALMQETYPYGYKAKIITDLSKVLKINNVDVVILNDVSCLLKHRVIYHGKVIYSCAEEKRINFQVRTIDEYIDFKRLLTIHRN